MHFNINNLLLLAAAVILASITRINSKILLNHIDKITLFVYSEIIFFLIALGFIMFGKANLGVFTKIDKKYVGLCVLNPFLISMNVIIFYHLLKQFEISTIDPIFLSSKYVLLLIAGYFLFNESLSHMKLLGILVSIIGILLLINGDKN